MTVSYSSKPPDPERSSQYSFEFENVGGVVQMDPFGSEQSNGAVSRPTFSTFRPPEETNGTRDSTQEGYEPVEFRKQTAETNVYDNLNKNEKNKAKADAGSAETSQKTEVLVTTKKVGGEQLCNKAQFIITTTIK